MATKARSNSAGRPEFEFPFLRNATHTEAPNLSQLRRRVRQLRSAPDFHAGTTRCGQSWYWADREFVRGGADAAPKRWAAGADCGHWQFFVPHLADRHSQNLLRSNPSSIIRNSLVERAGRNVQS